MIPAATPGLRDRTARPAGARPWWRLLVRPMAVAAGLLVCCGIFLLLPGSPGDPVVLNGPSLVGSLGRHVLLCGVAFAVVIVTCVPLGILVGVTGRGLRFVVFPLANIGQAIPGIGVLALLWAYLGIGIVPTVVALIAFSALPVLRNTMVGIQGVDPAAVGAARGMGMTRWQALWRVQVPLATPLIMAGLRTSLVLIIGTATLGSFIGGGGLGDVINAGINISDRIIFVGAVMVSALALLADWALGLVELAITPAHLRPQVGRIG